MIEQGEGWIKKQTIACAVKFVHAMCCCDDKISPCGSRGAAQRHWRASYSSLNF